MVEVTIAAEITNAGIIWRRLLVFIQPFKPSARGKVAGCVESNPGFGKQRWFEQIA
jgi:hypothetical protein